MSYLGHFLFSKASAYKPNFKLSREYVKVPSFTGMGLLFFQCSIPIVCNLIKV